MRLDRRSFAAGAVSALGTGWISPALAQNTPYAAALEAIRAYGEANLRHFALPGLTLALTAPDGFRTVLNFGRANLETPAPITGDTLFQIGSISKLINAAILHQYAAEGRLTLSSRVSDLLPSLPLPVGNRITVQDLLNHLAGLPADAPMDPAGGLWTAYSPGEHWSYSNTGYEILGRLIERVAGKPLAVVNRERIFDPLAMTHSRGAIESADRNLYAQGYRVADEGTFVPGVPLAPAPWVDLTFAAGNVASTGADMIPLLRSLADAAQGRGGLGLPTAAATAFTRHAVASDSPSMRYGNGLMHVDNGGRKYLHHTGGMLSFASSFHVDVGSGVGAFASTNLTGLAGYRPRLLTQFAVDALTSASTGGALPAPPSLYVRSTHAPAYLGRFAGPSGAFEIRSGNPLTIVADGKAAPLQPVGGELFRTTHPSFRAFDLMFERSRNVVVSAAFGSKSYVRAGSDHSLPASDRMLAKLAGRFVSPDPWFGTVIIVERGGRLWMGTETPLIRMAGNLFRVGDESWSPERALFDSFIEGRPQALVFSGARFARAGI